MSALYKPVKEKLWREAEEGLGLKEDTKGDPSGYVDSLIRPLSDNTSTMVYHTVVLEPTLKATPISQSGDGKVKPLTKKQKRNCRLLKIPKSQQKYSLYVSLHDLWTKYMIDLLKPNPKSNTKQLSLKVLKADLHGCLLKVVQSRNKDKIGTKGIVLQETQNTFILITEKDKVLIVPKVNTVFQFILQDHVFHIYGNQFRHRPGDRASRKYKDKHYKNL